MGWPMLRLLPWPTISSGCSPATAARTTSSTSEASRTFRVSTAAPSAAVPAGAGTHNHCPLGRNTVSPVVALHNHGGYGSRRAPGRRVDRVQSPFASKSRQLGKRQPATMDMDAAEFGAAVQGWKHLSRIEQPLRVERAFQPLLLVEIDFVEHLAHQVALLDADAMLPGQHPAKLDTGAQDIGAKGLRPL